MQLIRDTATGEAISWFDDATTDEERLWHSTVVAPDGAERVWLDATVAEFDAAREEGAVYVAGEGDSWNIL